MTDNIHDIWKEAVSDKQYTDENITDYINKNRAVIKLKQLLDEADPVQRKLIRNVVLNSTYGLMTRDYKIYNIPDSIDNSYWRQLGVIMNRYGTMDQPIKSFEISHARGYGKQISMGSFDEFYLDTDIAYSIFLTGEEHHKLALDSVIHWNVKFIPTIIVPPLGRGCKSWMWMNCFMHPRYKIKVRPGNESYLKDIKIDLRRDTVGSILKCWYEKMGYSFTDSEISSHAVYIKRFLKDDPDIYDSFVRDTDITTDQEKKQLERIVKRRNRNDSKRKRGKAR